MLLSHPLFQTLSELKGNPRATVLTELMFGIPYNLFAPFFSVYMLALGVTDQQIGSIASLGLFVQIFSALVSGAIVDKFGRRLTLFICDLICWSVPCLIWAVAQDVRYFVAAALMNSLWRISHTAWTCLIVEDAEERHLVHIWTWIMIFAVCSAFFAPLGGWFVASYGLVPAERGLYIFGFVVLTAKFVTLYLLSHETERGVKRMQETRHQSILSLLQRISRGLPSNPAFQAHPDGFVPHGDHQHLLPYQHKLLGRPFHGQTWLRQFTDFDLCGRPIDRHDSLLFSDRSAADQRPSLPFTPMDGVLRILHQPISARCHACSGSTFAGSQRGAGGICLRACQPNDRVPSWQFPWNRTSGRVSAPWSTSP